MERQYFQSHRKGQKWCALTFLSAPLTGLTIAHSSPKPVFPFERPSLAFIISLHMTLKPKQPALHAHFSSPPSGPHLN